MITHESKKFPVSLGSELINVATQISMWPCKKILQINKRSPTLIRQTRVHTRGVTDMNEINEEIVCMIDVVNLMFTAVAG